MNDVKLFSLARVLCALVVVAVVGIPAESAGTTTPKRSSVTRNPTTQKLSLTKKNVSAARARASRSRATQSQRARQLQEARQPRFKFDASGALVPDIRAEAAIIYDPKTGQVLWEQNSTDQRSIASITKVMTATVFLENNPDTSQMITVARSDVFQASTTHLRANDRVTVDDLLHLLLIASDNAAARALARVSPFGTVAFVQRMNEKAMELDLENTRYADPSGLLSDNVSSAYDMARLIAMASDDERISSIMRTSEYSLFTEKHRLIAFHSTNHLLGLPNVDVRAGKTGFISKSGYCLATLLRLPQGNPIAVVVLGARSNNGRFWETRHLFSWLNSKASEFFKDQSPK